MNEAQGIELARDFVQREFVDAGMVADLNVHWDIGTDGQPKPHAHVMLTMREIVVGEGGEAGFGAKVRAWSATAQDEKWRERRSEEHTSELQSVMRITYSDFFMKKKKNRRSTINTRTLQKTNTNLT